MSFVFYFISGVHFLDKFIPVTCDAYRAVKSVSLYIILLLCGSCVLCSPLFSMHLYIYVSSGDSSYPKLDFLFI